MSKTANRLLMLVRHLPGMVSEQRGVVLIEGTALCPSGFKCRAEKGVQGVYQFICNYQGPSRGTKVSESVSETFALQARGILTATRLPCTRSDEVLVE